MNKFICLVMLIFLLSGSLANATPCNRNHPDDADYLQPYEFCDDDVRRIAVPKFEKHFAERDEKFRPQFPDTIPGTEGDTEEIKKWHEAIRQTYKREGVNFAGHYIFVQRDCGTGCRLILLADLKAGIAYIPKTAPLIISSVNPLSNSMIKRIGIDKDEVCSYKPNSTLLVVVGSLGEQTKKNGIYFLNWEKTEFKVVSKVEKVR